MIVKRIIRSWFKAPAYAVATIVMLSIGIATSCATFTVVYSVLLKSFPYEHSNRIVMLWEKNTKANLAHDTPAPGNYLDWRDNNRSFVVTAAFKSDSFTLTDGTPERVTGVSTEPSLFRVLGVQPLLGRVFTPNDATMNSGRSVVLSYNIWKSHYNGNPAILGKDINIDGAGYTVIGVMPAEFAFPANDCALWVPLLMSPADWSRRDNHYLNVVGLLKDDSSLSSAQTELSIIAKGSERNYPLTNEGIGVSIVSLREQMVGTARTPLLVLLAAVFFLHLIACANVSNLLFTRLAARQSEISLQLALGARVWDIIRAVSSEILLLVAIGELIGVGLASITVRVISPFLPVALQISHLSLNLPVLGFTVVVGLLSGLLIAALPALKLKFQGEGILINRERMGSYSRTDRQTQMVFVGLQVCFALILLIMAGLVTRSVVNLMNAPVGFEKPADLLTMRLALDESQYGELSHRTSLYRGILDRVQSLPGVKSAAFTSYLPLTTTGASSTFYLQPGAPPSDYRSAFMRLVAGNYFKTMEMPLVSGRLFDFQDNASSPGVIVISRSLARQLWPGEDAVGKRVNFGDPGESRPWVTVVGVVGDVRESSLNEPPGGTIYRPFEQEPTFTFAPQDLVVRASNAQSLGHAVEAQIHEAAPTVAVYHLQTMKELIAASIVDRRFEMLLLGIFAVSALIISVVGVYGLLSYLVTQRQRDIGVRIALGATRRAIALQVLWLGMKPVVIGSLVGFAISFGLARALEALLVSVSPQDFSTYGASLIVLVAFSCFACLTQAARATRLDPLAAIREQ
jgi:putative ABC transport system permease protein